MLVERDKELTINKRLSVRSNPSVVVFGNCSDIFFLEFHREILDARV